MKKVLILIAVAVVIAVGILIAYNVITPNDSLVTIDINPSVQLVVNKEDKVANVIALDEDAEIVLSGLDSLVGLDVATATDQFLAEATLLGYIDVEATEEDPNAVLISVLSSTDSIQLKLQTKLQDRVHTYMQENGIWGICYTSDEMTEIVSEAQELGVPTGKLRMVKAILASGVTDQTQEQLLELTNKELVQIMLDKEVTDYKNAKETESAALKQMNQVAVEAHNQNLQQNRNNVRAGWENFENDKNGSNGTAIKQRFMDCFE